jgi:hypothetical protein
MPRVRKQKQGSGRDLESTIDGRLRQAEVLSRCAVTIRVTKKRRAADNRTAVSKA